MIVSLLGLLLSVPMTAEHLESRYSTLVVEFVGEVDRPVFTTVISTSREEGEWYKEALYKGTSRDFVDVFVVPRSTLADITELPLLKRELRRATPNGELHIRSPRIRFVVGTGHDHKEIALDEPTSAAILRDIDKRVSKYPEIESHIRDALDRISFGRN